MGITIYGFYPPAGSAIRKAEDDFKKSHFDRQKVKGKLIKAGVKWIVVNPEMFQTFDGDHLDSVEARKLSRYIKKSLFIGGSIEN